MKKINLKAITGLALSLIFVLAAAQGAQTSGRNSISRRIEGTWLVQVTDRNCQTGAVIGTIPALHTYLAGGSMLSDPAVPPAVLRTGHGIWKHVGGQSFTNTIVLFRFNPVNGAYEGTVTIRRNLELGEDSDEITSTDEAEAADASGNVLGTRCATTIARRLE